MVRGARAWGGRLWWPWSDHVSHSSTVESTCGMSPIPDVTSNTVNIRGGVEVWVICSWGRNLGDV